MNNPILTPTGLVEAFNELQSSHHNMMVKQGLWGLPLFKIGEVLLYMSLVQSLWSAKDYVVDFFKAFAEARRLKSREKRALREARIQARSQRLAAKAKTKVKE